MFNKIKKTIFWSLIALFIIDTMLVYSSGTTETNSKDVLSEDSKKGKLLFQQYNCIACHQIYGLGGYMGPDLTNVISNKFKGEQYARSFILGGTQRMPNFHLNSSEINQLIAYLKYVDKTGVYPVVDFKIKANGLIETE